VKRFLRNAISGFGEGEKARDPEKLKKGCFVSIRNCGCI
jgi:hypothetical protein